MSPEKYIYKYFRNYKVSYQILTLIIVPSCTQIKSKPIKKDPILSPILHINHYLLDSCNYPSGYLKYKNPTNIIVE